MAENLFLVGQSAHVPMSVLTSGGGIMSRTIKFARAGGPEVLEFIEMEVPAPGPNEIRIKVKAIGINRAESMWRNDKYVESPVLPAGLGYDCAGVVDAVGKEVAGFAVGDAVSTIPAPAAGRLRLVKNSKAKC
jgi:NADPH:quinone reductase-like Zn-dependent oxidoreductase